jgi:hypothetical protein
MNTQYVLNPNTNRFVLRTSLTAKRLVKAGLVPPEAEGMPAPLTITHRRKAVANLDELSIQSQIDLAEQLEAMRLKREKASAGTTVAKRGRPPKIGGARIPDPVAKPVRRYRVKIEDPQTTTTDYDETDG